MLVAEEETPGLSGSGRYTSRGVEDPVVSVECPMCINKYPLGDIADHADRCADIWVGCINDQEVSIIEDTPLPPITSTSTTVSVKEVITALPVMEVLRTQKPLKLRVRRAMLWGDVQGYSTKISASHTIKVEYIGEPSTDDGGPRREFFSGTEVD